MFRTIFLTERKKQTWYQLLLRPFRIVVKFTLLRSEFSFSRFLFLVLLRVRDLDICFFIRFSRNNCLVTCSLWKFSQDKSRRIYFGYCLFSNIFFCLRQWTNWSIFIFYLYFSVNVAFVYHLVQQSVTAPAIIKNSKPKQFRCFRVEAQWPTALRSYPHWLLLYGYDVIPITGHVFL